mgnify:CR=1 FL=1
MGRIRLTQIFPCLLPLRKKQKIFCYYIGMRLDHNRYSETRSDTMLANPLFYADWPLYNYETGYELIYQENKAYNCSLAASLPQGKHFHFGTLFGMQTGKFLIRMAIHYRMESSSCCLGAGCAK